MSSHRPVLLTVSGTIPADLKERTSAGDRPRADYAIMAQEFDADLVDEALALSECGTLGRVIRRLGGVGALLGWFCFRMRSSYDVIVTDGEQVGLVFAAIGRIFGRGTARHMMIVHIISSRSKTLMIRAGGLDRCIDRYVTYCSWQSDYIVKTFGVDPDAIIQSTFMVDASFFTPGVESPATTTDGQPMICSAGLERRDYEILLEAVDGLDVAVVIAAASPWSKRDDPLADRADSANVTIRRLDLASLREVYRSSRFVVMPLEPVEFQAGITTILEAMSVGRAVLCTRTAGQNETIEEGVTGRYVRPRDADEMRTVIVGMLADEAGTRKMGTAARQWVLAHADVEVYAQRLARDVQALRSI